MNNPADNRSFILSSDHIDSTDLQHVDPDTRDRLQALLEAAGKFSVRLVIYASLCMLERLYSEMKAWS